MKIEMGKKYRNENGDNVTILMTNYRNPHMAGETVLIAIHKDNFDLITAHKEDGTSKYSGRLIEIRPYDDLKIDDKVIVWNDDDPFPRFSRHFAGVNNKTGKPMTWKDGGTSWSTKLTDDWNHCERAEI